MHHLQSSSVIIPQRSFQEKKNKNNKNKKANPANLQLLLLALLTLHHATPTQNTKISKNQAKNTPQHTLTVNITNLLLLLFLIYNTQSKKKKKLTLQNSF